MTFYGSVEYSGEMYDPKFLNKHTREFLYAIQNFVEPCTLQDWVSVERLLGRSMEYGEFLDFVDVIDRVYGDDATEIRNDHYDIDHFVNHELDLIEIILDEKKK